MRRKNVDKEKYYVAIMAKQERKKKVKAKRAKNRRELRKMITKRNVIKNRGQILERSKDCNLKRKYGITLKEKKEMVLFQNNCCMICGRKFKNSKDEQLDHDHISKKIRGILCSNCNTMLGLARESPDVLKEAIKYLKEFTL